MIYLIDDKRDRQAKDYNWNFDKLSKYKNELKPIYSLQQIDNENLSFEAGFGNENFGSVVKIPLHAVFQIIVDESILYINSVATVDKFNKDLKKNSFNIFKSNPNNKKFDK
jgi:hypothetical protein